MPTDHHHGHRPYRHPLNLSTDERDARAETFHALMNERRTVRDFSDRLVPREIIETAIRTAGTAPSGANQQPWTFVAISDAATKKAIRDAAEEEERAFYSGRAGQDWLDALAPLGTDAEKPFLETAPWLIAIFAQRWGEGDERTKHYYVPESVGIASGLLIAALHNAGLATLTHTPAPMGFLTEICDRPANEKPVILLVTGYAADDCKVPDISRKPLSEIARFI
ncbi:MAG: nitroreductase family protein [Pseudomonadota bacterium]